MAPCSADPGPGQAPPPAGAADAATINPAPAPLVVQASARLRPRGSSPALSGLGPWPGLRPAALGSLGSHPPLTLTLLPCYFYFHGLGLTLFTYVWFVMFMHACLGERVVSGVGGAFHAWFGSGCGLDWGQKQEWEMVGF